MRIFHYRNLYGRGEFSSSDICHYYDFRLTFEHLFAIEVEPSRFILGAVRTRKHSNIVGDLILQKERGNIVNMHWFGITRKTSLENLVFDLVDFLINHSKEISIRRFFYERHDFHYTSCVEMRMTSIRRIWRPWLESQGIHYDTCRFVHANLLNQHWYILLCEWFPRDVLMNKYLEGTWKYLIIVNIHDHSGIFCIPLSALYQQKCLSVPSYQGKSYIPIDYAHPERYWTRDYHLSFPL